MKLLAILILLVAGYIAYKAAKRKAEEGQALSEQIVSTGRGLDDPEMDEAFAHQVTPADQVQAFRDGGAV